MSKFIKKKVKKGEVLELTFSQDEMDPSLINAFRRILIGEVHSWSLMGNLIIHSNTSSYNDEYLTNRIQMVPIYLPDPKDLKIFDQNLVFHISAPGDPEKPLVNDQDTDLVVSSHMFQLYHADGLPSKLSIEDLITYDLPLLKLRKGQEFHLSVGAARGIGTNHTTWKSCIVTQKYDNPVSMGTVNAPKSNPINNLPFETIEQKRAYPQDRWGNPQQITLTLKPNGHFDPMQCFLLAIDELEEKLLNFRLLVDNPMGAQEENITRVEIIPSTDIENYLQIKVMDPPHSNQPLATHTLGNLLSNHMFYRLYDLVKGNLDKIRESMASYRPPHPLDDIIYLNIKTPEGLYRGLDGHASLKLLDDTIEDLLKYLRQLRQEATS